MINFENETENLDQFKTKTKDELLNIITANKLKEKRLQNKISSLNAEIKYLKRHMQKIKDTIEKVLKIKIEEDTWNVDNKFNFKK
jgi:uncharacterized protein YdcH (DUF465 family)